MRLRGPTELTSSWLAASLALWLVVRRRLRRPRTASLRTRYRRCGPGDPATADGGREIRFVNGLALSGDERSLYSLPCQFEGGGSPALYEYDTKTGENAVSPVSHPWMAAR